MDRRRRIRGLPKKASLESRLRWKLKASFFDLDAAAPSPLLEVGNQALHMEMERTHEFLPEEFFDASDSSDEPYGSSLWQVFPGKFHMFSQKGD